MDLFLPIVLFIVFCVLFSICGWCCKKHREGTVYGYAGNPAVTVTTQQAPSVVPPYPVHPQPHVMPPGAGFVPTGGYQAGPYPVTQTAYPLPPAPGFYSMPIAGGYPPATPYPVSGTVPYPTSTSPYPPTNAMPSSSAPYPTQQLPPSYMEAVGQPPTEPHRIVDGYTKQDPYNPHY